MEHNISTKILRGLLLVGVMGLGSACSKNVFMKESENLSSQSETPLNLINSIPSKITVAYPSYAKVNNSPLQYIETELFVNTQNDKKTCLIQSISKPEGANEQLCVDIPDLCWSNSVASVSKETDFTCAQAYRALEISKVQPDQQCNEKIDLLSEKEKEQVYTPDVYTISLSSSDASLLLNPAEANLNAIIQTQLTNLPQLTNIKLDSACRCHYTFENSSIDATGGMTSGIKYEYPSLPEHCHSHFANFYN
jgi:hypothetical protein